MYVCMHVQACIYIHMYVHLYVCLHTYVCMNIHSGFLNHANNNVSLITIFEIFSHYGTFEHFLKNLTKKL